MAAQSIPTDSPNSKSIPALQGREDGFTGDGPRAYTVPPTEANFRELASMGCAFSTSTLPGLLKAYLDRAEDHYRSPEAGQDEITAGYQNEALRPLLLAALKIASSAQSARAMVKDALAEAAEDPEGAARMLADAASTAWCAADDADRLAVEIGKLAQAVGAA